MTEFNKSDDWFSDDTFWQDYASLIFDSERWAEVPSNIDSVLALSNIYEPVSVLDLCCGPGRHALELAKRNFSVVGVDITKPYIEAAEESAKASGLDIKFIHADMRTWCKKENFDLAINLYTSFGYCDTKAEDELILKQAFKSLKPGGVLVLETLGKEVSVKNFKDGEWFEHDGRIILTEFEVVGAWEGLQNRWVIIDKERRVDRKWVLRLYAGTELRDSMLNSGFASVQLYGSYNGAPYDQDAETLIAVAKKSG